MRNETLEHKNGKQAALYKPKNYGIAQGASAFVKNYANAM
jgi:hypothetical protein